MACKVRYLNSAGIMRREIRGVEALAEAFPSHWLLYASLTCYPKAQAPIEIDIAVVLEDRILLLELKDWNGKLSSQGDCWFLGKQNRGRSPVVVLNEKARKLKGILVSELPTLKTALFVDSRVVLAGTATRDALSGHEKPHVWTLPEAKAISDPVSRSHLLSRGRLGLIKLTNFESEFDRVTGNRKLFAASEADWGGYKVTSPDLFVHPKKIWREHISEKKADPRIKALLRVWSFNLLPPALNSPDRRQLIAARESRAYAHLSAMGSDLVHSNSILREISADREEILTDHFELRGILPNWKTLDRYLESTSESLTFADRLVLAGSILKLGAELHRFDVVHRDLGPRAVWTGSPNRIAVSGLMSCKLPEDETVVDWLSTLRGYAADVPEDRVGAIAGSAKQRDVYLLAKLVEQTLSTAGSRGVEDSPFTQWFDRALSPDPRSRFDDARAMNDSFAELADELATPRIDNTVLDRFETHDVPYQLWPTVEILKKIGNASVYSSRKHDVEVCVKIWNGLRRGDSAATDLSLIRLLQSASSVMVAPIRGVPRFLEAGLSPVGPYVVYQQVRGSPLRDVQSLEPIDALNLSLEIIRATDSLHKLGCEHGDISLANCLYDAGTKEFCLIDPFDITNVGEGRLSTPEFTPDNAHLLSQQAIDRFGTLKLVDHVLSLSTQSAQLVYCRSVLSDELSRPVVETLDVLAASVRAAIDQITAPPQPKFALTTRSTRQHFQPVEGRYFVTSRSVGASGVRYVLTGRNLQLRLDSEGGTLLGWDFQDIDYRTLAQASSDGLPLDIRIELAHGPDSGFVELFDLIAQSFSPKKSVTSGKQPDTSGINVPQIWRRLLELEADDRVAIEILADLGTREDARIFRYQNIGQPFDFDPDEPVDVYLASGNTKIGEIDHSMTDSVQTIAIRLWGRLLGAGDRLVLVGRREQVSITRRTKAVERILDRDSAIPPLIEYFVPGSGIEAHDYGLVPDESELAPYDLNAGQQSAFSHILRWGPVGFLQGPPGTGKTRFIASLIHWLSTKGGATRVLVASQSHEAVNNAIEALVGIYKKSNSRPNLLRVGSRGISESTRPYHTVELRERYRVRFEAAARFRFAHLATAKGIPRELARDVFDLDHRLGHIARRCVLLRKLMDAERAADEKQRISQQLQRATAAFAKEFKQFVGAEAKDHPLQELDRAFDLLLANNATASPFDLRAARQLLKLCQDWIAALSSRTRNFDEFLAKTRDIITATCVGVGQTRIRIETQLFDWVIVDEAARCTPGELAVPIQLGRRVLLVGDHLQLRPMFGRNVIQQYRGEASISVPELLKSDFERSFTAGFAAAFGNRLTEQYRMDPAICEMISKCFYEPHSIELTTSPRREKTANFDKAAWDPIRRPIVWVDTSSDGRRHEEQPENTYTFFNEAEVAAVLSVLDRLSRDEVLVRYLRGLPEESPIGVICMYSAQRDKIERSFSRRGWDPAFRRLVRIDTVDAYQGKENSIVIVSLVRSNSHRDPGHVGSPNRCNVALSRARDRLVIVGDVDFWGKPNHELSDAACLRVPSRQTRRRVGERRDHLGGYAAGATD